MSVLSEIIARKRDDVASRKDQQPIAALHQRAVLTARSFADALRRPGPRFILEYKRASPSEGVLRSDYDLPRISDAYRGFADAVSVLTDGPFFGGDVTHLQMVRSQMDVPILCKDFVIDPYQVVEARAAGADAILMMLSVLDDEGYRRCAAEAARWNMEVLTEVHDEAELGRALALGAEVIGINNRNLRTLEVDLDVTSRLAPRIPADRVVVSESGIQSRADVDAISEYADAVLVGSQLMKSDRLDLAVRELIFGGVKVCGLRSQEQAGYAYAAGASWGGLLLAPESPRRVELEQARAVAYQCPLRWVGVFVNESRDQISNAARELGLCAIQLHGEETEDYVVKLRSQLPAECEIWKAVRVQGKIPQPAEYGVDRIVLDTFSDVRRGGTGISFDWNLLRACPHRSRYVLAGGIRPENVRRAYNTGCGILDVNSGVESAPGEKDEARLRQLFDALREAP